MWNILKNYPKWDAVEPFNADNLQEPFGPDTRERPAGKQRAKIKQKSVETTSVGGSTRGSTEGSQSESVSSLCKELEFLMIDPSPLPPAKRVIIESKQAEIMRKYHNTNPNAAL
ncbi:hypothetical protein Tco_0135305 [Tanacetum coccineum]